MTTVYVLNLGVYYEGDRVQGIFSSKEDAVQRAEKWELTHDWVGTYDYVTVDEYKLGELNTSNQIYSRNSKE